MACHPGMMGVPGFILRNELSNRPHACNKESIFTVLYPVYSSWGMREDGIPPETKTFNIIKNLLCRDCVVTRASIFNCREVDCNSRAEGLTCTSCCLFMAHLQPITLLLDMVLKYNIMYWSQWLYLLTAGSRTLCCFWSQDSFSHGSSANLEVKAVVTEPEL